MRSSPGWLCEGRPQANREVGGRLGSALGVSAHVHFACGRRHDEQPPPRFGEQIRDVRSVGEPLEPGTVVAYAEYRVLVGPVEIDGDGSGRVPDDIAHEFGEN